MTNILKKYLKYFLDVRDNLSLVVYHKSVEKDNQPNI